MQILNESKCPYFECGHFFMHKLFILIGFLAFSLEGIAQPVNLGDSLKHYLDQERRLVLRLDTRNSFITGRAAQIRGVKAAFSYGDRLSIGIGYNWLRKDFNQDLVVEEEGVSKIYNAELHFAFVSPFAEYVFYDRKGFSVALPVQIGLGNSWLSYSDANGNKERTARQFVLLYEPAMTIEQRVLKYFAVGCGFGYRLMLRNNQSVDANFTSPIYLIRLRILFLEIYNNIARGPSSEQ